MLDPRHNHHDETTMVGCAVGEAAAALDRSNPWSVATHVPAINEEPDSGTLGDRTRYRTEGKARRGFDWRNPHILALH